jgi:hypothetical protein
MGHENGSWINSDQRSAVRSCGENGHNWTTSEHGEDYCLCCGWPRSAVAKHAGGERPDYSEEMFDILEATATPAPAKCALSQQRMGDGPWEAQCVECGQPVCEHVRREAPSQCEPDRWACTECDDRWCETYSNPETCAILTGPCGKQRPRWSAILTDTEPK